MLRAVYRASSGGGGISTCASPSTIFNQTWDGTVGNGVASDLDGNGGNGDYAKAYESFSFAGGAIVTDLHWTGYYTPDADGSPPRATAWLIEFWNDNAGVPGTLNQTAVFTPALANETLIGTVGSNKVYSYSVDLLPWFLADVGVTYWVSVHPTVNFLPQFTEWFWATAGAGSCYSVFFASPSSPAFNLAFYLTGCTGAPISGDLVLEDGTSYLLLEDGTSKIILE